MHQKLYECVSCSSVDNPLYAKLPEPQFVDVPGKAFVHIVNLNKIK